MITPCIEETCSGNGTKIHMNPASKKYGVLLLSALVLFGCAGMLSGFGTNVLDEIAWDNFETFQIDPDMNYYASGPHDDYPIVIMGLKKQYVLISGDHSRPIPSSSSILLKACSLKPKKLVRYSAVLP
jgi:hypothetical protein